MSVNTNVTVPVGRSRRMRPASTLPPGLSSGRGGRYSVRLSFACLRFALR